MKIRYTDPAYGDSILLRVKDFSIQLERNKWVDIPQEEESVLRMQYKFLLSEKETVYPNYLIFNEKNKKIAFRRTFAIGDLLMFVPIINFLNKTTVNNYYLLTQRKYVSAMKSFGIFSGVGCVDNYMVSDFDAIVYLDGVLEKDHSLTNPQRFKHRTIMYMEYLNLQIKKFDWNVKNVKI